VYACIKMVDYLMSNDASLTVTDNRYVFAMRSRMVSIPANFSLNQTNINCACGDKEDMWHFYSCTFWNTEKEIIEYKIIFTDHVTKMAKVYETFLEYYQKREKCHIENVETKKQCEENTPHGILNCDPLFSLLEASNGNSIFFKYLTYSVARFLMLVKTDLN
jgi:hypothetical protein